jgi:predicted cupin superfamily sugar epimerase
VRIESFVVGLDRGKGKKQRWLVEGGRYKARFLLPDRDEEGMLVSETVVPGFQYF